MDDIDQINNGDKDKWMNRIISIGDLLPQSLKYLLVFAATAFIGSIASYYINPTGLLCGVLAVLIYYKMK